MSNDRIVIREPRLDLGTNREVPTSLIGEQAYDWLAIHHPKTNAAAVRDGNAAAVDRPAAFIDDELLVAVQGDPTSPAAKNSFIDYGQAVNQTVAQSTAMADVHKPAVAAAQAGPAQQQEPNKVAVGAH